MDEEDKIIVEWLITKMAANALQNFAALIIAHAGGTLSEAALAEVRAECITNVQNAQVIGLPIEQETELFRQALQKVEQFPDGAIARGRQG
jgi:hypothetical protein